MARKQATNLAHENVVELKQPAPKPSNHLRLRIDDLKTFDPLTQNQELFFDAYKRGDYFVALHGVCCLASHGFFLLHEICGFYRSPMSYNMNHLAMRGD